jgi:amino acid adenylation domain-containing protein
MIKNEGIEAIYPLSPMQEGLLFHSLQSPDSGIYFVQLCSTLEGELNVVALKETWRQLIDRHAVLRTLFVWERREKPLQVVLPGIDLPWEERNWQGLSPSGQQARIEAFLKADREAGFDLSKGPLIRLALIKQAERSHRFVWTFHHILLDGWSVPRLLDEFFRVYQSICSGDELRLDPVRPYREYISWLGAQDRSGSKHFWRETLKDFTEPTALGVDRPATQSSAGDGPYDEQQIHLSETATKVLQSTAKQNELTLNILVQGAWALLLNRYSCDQRVLFGATFSGRPAELPGVESMIGLFINTLPILVQVAPDESVIEWLSALQSQTLEIRQHEYSPLAEVRRWSGVRPEISLFESIFIFENYPVRNTFRQLGPGLLVRDVEVFERTNYPLTVVSAPSSELMLRIVYDTTRFDVATVSRMLGHFRSLVEGMAANLGLRIMDLELLTEGERGQMLVDWNDTSTPYPDQARVSDLFEKQVTITPDAAAVVTCEGHLTYLGLNNAANQLADDLQRLGVGPEVRAGICAERSPEMVIALLAVLKAGGAYLPLDPSYPTERLAFMLEDSGALLLLAQRHLIGKLPQTGIHTISLDPRSGVIVGESCENPRNGAVPGTLGYVIYTSGSTGKPKGVLIERRGLNNLAQAQIRAFDVRPDSRVLQLASFSFDASVSEVFMALLSGASLYLEAQESPAMGAEFVEFLRSSGVTAITFPPSALAALPDNSLPSLATIVCAGEACPAELVARWGPGRRFLNAYGPTESTVCATIGEPGVADRRPPIGRPVANAQVYLADPQMRLVPVGVPGELYIGGTGLARGYANRADLTAERFIPNPFSREAGARLYRTGDLARYLSDGNIDFIGRIDHQVKVRGYRIELGEIEAALRRQPGIQETVVIVGEPAPGDKRLIAYLVPRQGETLDVSQLRNVLAGILPAYMVPSAFVTLDALPLTPNGKVNRRALPAPGRVDSGAAYAAPGTEVERMIRDVWLGVLKIDRAGINDNFFDLGGHSLLMIQVQGKLRQALGKPVSITDLFKYPTIRSLAAFLASDTTRPPSPRPASRIERLKEGKNRLKQRAGFAASRQPVDARAPISPESM